MSDFETAFIALMIVQFMTLISTGIVIHHQQKEIRKLREDRRDKSL